MKGALVLTTTTTTTTTMSFICMAIKETYSISKAFEQLFGLGRGEFEQQFSKNSNARGVARGGMLKLRFDWYIIRTKGVKSRLCTF